MKVLSTKPEAIRISVLEYVKNLRASHPEIKQIIWFGSWITGIPTPASDVDICIILSHSDKRIRHRIPDYLPFGFPVGIDVFPYTIEEFDRLKSQYPKWYEAINQGLKL
ncbi:MAG: nucleotidyltransferase domain-containing protein [Bacteroidota bacterium]